MSRIALCGILLLLACEQPTSKKAEPKQATAPKAEPKPKPKPARKPVDPVKTARREELIQQLIASRIFAKVEKPGLYPYIWTGPAFASLSFEEKGNFCNVVFGYYFEGEDLESGSAILDRDHIVLIRDGMTGKEIGEYSRRNVGLKMY